MCITISITVCDDKIAHTLEAAVDANPDGVVLGKGADIRDLIKIMRSEKPPFRDTCRSQMSSEPGQ